jgi:hypothetical protein
MAVDVPRSGAIVDDEQYIKYLRVNALLSEFPDATNGKDKVDTALCKRAVNVKKSVPMSARTGLLARPSEAVHFLTKPSAERLPTQSGKKEQCDFSCWCFFFYPFQSPLSLDAPPNAKDL